MSSAPVSYQKLKVNLRSEIVYLQMPSKESHGIVVFHGYQLQLGKLREHMVPSLHLSQYNCYVLKQTKRQTCQKRWISCDQENNKSVPSENCPDG